MGQAQNQQLGQTSPKGRWNGRLTSLSYSSSAHEEIVDQDLGEATTSTTICREIIAILANHGCTDLTASIDESACDEYPVVNGGSGDIFRGKLHDGTAVAIKTVRSYHEQGQSADAYHKRAAREIYTWSKCKHPNVVELLGSAIFHDCLAMISRWEPYGSLLHYLSLFPNADRCRLSKSICAGLAYLHDNAIIHGDLKGSNVLVSQEGTAMLVDFGNAHMQDSTLQFVPTSIRAGFSFRWAAPEILVGKISQSTAGDVYSLGMTILEALTSKIPYAGITDKSLAALKVGHKLLPTRPEEALPRGSTHSDNVWAILIKCWNEDPQDRPSAREVWEEIMPITSDNLAEIKDQCEGNKV